eukprot:CAMPEP_0202711326 /NCGR_PEP_ID=MMETSP1385-20130828/23156_1 /ASSEMBLY_ACC=CAM_ASM_000861 /TAXON_ID=933848 /ORGANISM="Elphidium margaritaceum" /LENGTH=1374 /DNA_ID=CAMNT_0049371043 /DNA_START=58 /DNA_END=4182 /DNA_ORIENTATION=+
MADAHHDIVSKMARKYSQYKLPHPSELNTDSDPDAQEEVDDDKHQANQQRPKVARNMQQISSTASSHSQHAHQIHPMTPAQSASTVLSAANTLSPQVTDAILEDHEHDCSSGTYRDDGVQDTRDRSGYDDGGSACAGDDDDVDEDEDILSETQTMISHKSNRSMRSMSSSHHYNAHGRHHSMHRTPLHKSKSTNVVSVGHHHHHHHGSLGGGSGGKHRKVQFHNEDEMAPEPISNPMEEIREIQMDRTYFKEIFDKYFDEENQEDVDLTEFKKGLSRLGGAGVQHSDEQLRKIFNVLLAHGGNENDGYLDRDQFGEFLTSRFEAPQLVAYQQLLITVISDQAKVDSTRPTLMDAENADKWEVAELSLAEIEMRHAMEQMVDDEMERYKVLQEFREELDRRAADPQFCVDVNADDWSCYEVAQWVARNGYEYAMKRFFDQQIDGNVLLYDVNDNMLVNQLGITQLHCNKFLRALQDLRVAVAQHKRPRNGPLECEFEVTTLEIVSQTAHAQQQLRDAQHTHELEVQSWQRKLLDAESQRKLCDTETAAEKLQLQREINEFEEKFLAAQREIVTLTRSLNEKQEQLSTTHNVHISKLNELQREHENALHAMHAKLVDYDSMKASYDAICAQLNEAKQALTALRLEHENSGKANEFAVESMRRQFERENDALSEQIKRLTAVNEQLSDENKKTRKASQHGGGSDGNESKIGPLWEHAHESDNPYLDLSSPKMAALSASASSSTSASNSGNGMAKFAFEHSAVSAYVQELTEKAKHDQQHFGNHQNVAKWSTQEVAYWLTTIKMEKYIAPFVEEYVDGQSLLHDLTMKNLVSDLGVKSLHAPKIMRLIGELKRESATEQRKLNHRDDALLQLTLAEHVTNFHHASFVNTTHEELRTQNEMLKTDLSSTRMRMHSIQQQLEDSKKTLSTSSDMTRHLRTESNATAKSNKSNKSSKSRVSMSDDADWDESTPPPVPEHEPLSMAWRQYVEFLQQRNQNLSQRYFQIKAKLMKFVNNIGPTLHARIDQLEENTREQSRLIDKLNNRIVRRNATVEKLRTELSTYQALDVNLDPRMDSDKRRKFSMASTLSTLTTNSNYSDVPVPTTRSSAAPFTTAGGYAPHSHPHPHHHHHHHAAAGVYASQQQPQQHMSVPQHAHHQQLSTHSLPTPTGFAATHHPPSHPHGVSSAVNNATVITPDMQRLLKQQQSNYVHTNYPELHQHPERYDVRYAQYSSIPRGSALSSVVGGASGSVGGAGAGAGGGGGMVPTHKKYASSSSLFKKSGRKKKASSNRKKAGIILNNANQSGKPHIVGLMSGSSTTSVHSAASAPVFNDPDLSATVNANVNVNVDHSNNGSNADAAGGGSMLTSLATMAYGYVMGGT